MPRAHQNRLLAAETLGFYSRALQYDRIYFWCLGNDMSVPQFNPMVNALVDAVDDLADRLKEQTLQELHRVLLAIQKEWNDNSLR